MKRETVRAILTLVGVFLLGAIVGVGGTIAVRHHHARGPWGDPGAPMGAMRLRALSRTLDLSEEQHDRIERILEDHREGRRAAWEKAMADCGEPLRKSKAELDAQIRAVLNPKQLEKFDELSRRQQERFFPMRPRPR